jgi:hypothetical protein
LEKSTRIISANAAIVDKLSMGQIVEKLLLLAKTQLAKNPKAEIFRNFVKNPAVNSSVSLLVTTTALTIGSILPMIK